MSHTIDVFAYSSWTILTKAGALSGGNQNPRGGSQEGMGKSKHGYLEIHTLWTTALFGYGFFVWILGWDFHTPYISFYITCWIAFVTSARDIAVEISHADTTAAVVLFYTL
jgi:hypothetical protein